VNPKIAGKWMFIPLKIVLIGIDPYPYGNMNPTTPAMTAHDCRVVQGVPASTSLWVKAILSELVAGLFGGSEDTTRRGWPGFMANLRQAWDYMGLYGIIMDCNGL